MSEDRDADQVGFLIDAVSRMGGHLHVKRNAGGRSLLVVNWPGEVLPGPNDELRQSVIRFKAEIIEALERRSEGVKP